jgi:hypothetical protein
MAENIMLAENNSLVFPWVVLGLIVVAGVVWAWATMERSALPQALRRRCLPRPTPWFSRPMLERGRSLPAVR